MAQLAPVHGKNLIVCGLPQSINGDDLHAMFAKVAPVVSSKLMMNVKAGGHRGFGFVLFENSDDAARAKDALHGVLVDPAPSAGKNGRLRVDFADRDTFNVLTDIVHNIPITATNLDVVKYFAQFGEVVDCTLRSDSTRAGQRPSLTAFVEYADAKAAKEAVAKGTGATPFADKTVPLLVKLADTTEIREERRLREQQQQCTAPEAPSEPLSVVEFGNANNPVQQLLFSRDAKVYQLVPPTPTTGRQVTPPQLSLRSGTPPHAVPYIQPGAPMPFQSPHMMSVSEPHLELARPQHHVTAPNVSAVPLSLAPHTSLGSVPQVIFPSDQLAPDPAFVGLAPQWHGMHAHNRPMLVYGGQPSMMPVHGSGGTPNQSLLLQAQTNPHQGMQFSQFSGMPVNLATEPQLAALSASQQAQFGVIGHNVATGRKT